MTVATPTFSDPVVIALINMVGIFLTAVFSALTAYMTNRNTGKIKATQTIVEKTQATVESHGGTIAELAKNTNSMKDALVLAVGEREFDRGLGIGSNAAREDPSGTAALLADIHTKAAHAQGVVEGTTNEKNRAAAEAAADINKKDV